MSVVTVRRDGSPWRSADRLAGHTGGSRSPAEVGDTARRQRDQERQRARDRVRRW